MPGFRITLGKRYKIYCAGTRSIMRAAKGKEDLECSAVHLPFHLFRIPFLFYFSILRFFLSSSDTGSTPRTQPCYLFLFFIFYLFLFLSTLSENYLRFTRKRKGWALWSGPILTAARSWLDAVIRKMSKLPAAKPQVQYRKKRGD